MPKGERHQACTIPQVIVTSYFSFDLLSFDEFFFGEEKISWLPSENKVADKNLDFQSTNFTVKSCTMQIAMFSFLIRHFVIRRHPV